MQIFLLLFFLQIPTSIFAVIPNKNELNKKFSIKANTTKTTNPPLAFNSSDFCYGENMVYKTFSWSPKDVLKGTRKFSCQAMELLERFKLLDKQNISKPIPVKKFGKGAVFLLAANALYFPYLKKALHSIKQVFGRPQKVIVYDLGGISGNAKMDTTFTM